MSGKSRVVARLESDIEKSRAECNWSKACDLAKQLSEKSSALGSLCALVIAEGKLERHLLEHPPNEKNYDIAKEQLSDIKKQLTDLSGADIKSSWKLESNLLLCKVMYAMGLHQEALLNLEEAGLDNLTLHSVSSRMLRIIAEAYAVKGHCLEKIPMSSSSKYKHAEREEQIIACFEKAGDISLLQIQQQDCQGVAMTTGANNTPVHIPEPEAKIGPIIESAIQRSPLVYIRNGKLSQGIGRFRELLRAMETKTTKHVRQTLVRQLAEVLLRGVCEKSYTKISMHPHIPDRRSAATIRPKQYTGSGLFVPKNECEESLLLLLIAEAMATKEAILNRSPDLQEARLHTFHNVCAVYDLLTIALVRRAQFDMIAESFEKAMKFSFDEFHIWYQFGQSLICAEKYDRALLVLKECLRLKPTHVVLLLQMATLCYDHIHLYDEGLELAKQAVQHVDDPIMAARANVTLGIGYSLKEDEVRLQSKRKELQKKALSLFKKAHGLDTNDHLPLFYIALQYAILRQIPEAIKYVRRALRIRGDHINSLHLLVLLLSADKQYHEALELAKAAISEYPSNFGLLMTKCKLEEAIYGVEEALHTCKYLLKLWKQVFEPKLLNEQKGTGLIDKVTADHRSLVQLQLTDLSDRDSGSVRADSIAASRVEQALSEVASSMNSSLHPRTGVQHPWLIQAQIWLLLAEFYLNLERIEEAHACILEAGNIFPLSHQVSYMRGRLHEYKQEYSEAKSCYENAVSINPGHIKSLQHLGMVLHRMQHGRMAEKILMDAVNADPHASQSWHCLGQVLHELGEYESSSECLSTAVELEGTGPILPFTVIPKTLS